MRGILGLIAAPTPFTYRQAAQEHAFIQVPLLEAPRFIEAAVQRGFPKFDEAGLEGLDREGLLPPVAFRLGGYATGAPRPRCYGTTASSCARSRKCVPWNELRSAHGATVPGALMPMYSQWRLLTLWELWSQLHPLPAAPFLRAGLDATLADRKAVAARVDRDGLAATARAGGDATFSSSAPKRFSFRGSPVSTSPLSTRSSATPLVDVPS